MDCEDTRAEAGEALRALIDEVRLTPDPAAGVIRAELYGELGAILAMTENKNRTSRGEVRFSLVAGAAYMNQLKGPKPVVVPLIDADQRGERRKAA